MVTVKLVKYYNEIHLFFPNYKMASAFVADYAENLEEGTKIIIDADKEEDQDASDV